MHQENATLLNGNWNVKLPFDQLKELCTTTPILAYADFTKPFKLHTDASVLALGDVLYQLHESVEKVISYASRSLTQSETKYPVHKLEFLFFFLFRNKYFKK